MDEGQTVGTEKFHSNFKGSKR